MDDHTSRYMGEAVELALFGGEYQDGVLTSYCVVADVPHIELNGHILVPLQNVAVAPLHEPLRRSGRLAAAGVARRGRGGRDDDPS